MQSQQHTDAAPTQGRVAACSTLPSKPGGWVHRFFRLHRNETALIEAVGGREIDDDAFQKLKSKEARVKAGLSAANPQLECSFCQAPMSWDPSTTRKLHLFKCQDFLSEDVAKNHSQFQRERTEWIEEQAVGAKV